MKYYTHYDNGLFNNGINNQTRDTGKTHMLNARESGRVTQCAPVTHARVWKGWEGRGVRNFHITEEGKKKKDLAHIYSFELLNNSSV